MPPKKKAVTRKKGSRNDATVEDVEEGAGGKAKGKRAGSKKNKGADATREEASDKNREKSCIAPVDSARAISDFVSHISSLGADGCRKQYESVKGYEPPDKCYTTFLQNATKNRYVDVMCQETTRVKLQVEPGHNDYIHANWVKLDGCNRNYIATQGPLDETIEDFWRMVFFENVNVVIMLCKTIEDGKAKCAQYWPLEVASYKTYGKMFINNKKSENDDKFTIYTLEVLPEGCSNSNIVKLFHLTSWPDRGVALSARTVLRLMRGVGSDKLATGPVVCHCSAGIGRTGTIIMIDWILHQLFTKGVPVDPVDLMKTLRNQRLSAVQTDGQWLFLLSTVIEYITIKQPKHLDAGKKFINDVVKAGLAS